MIPKLTEISNIIMLMVRINLNVYYIRFMAWKKEV